MAAILTEWQLAEELDKLGLRFNSGTMRVITRVLNHDGALRIEVERLRELLLRCADAMQAWGNEEDGIPSGGLGKGINAFEAYQDARSILAASTPSAPSPHYVAHRATYGAIGIDGPDADSVDRATPGQGWHCERCQRGVPPSEVTYEETHTICGRQISADDAPVGYHRATVEACVKAIEKTVVPNEVSPYTTLGYAADAVRALLTSAPPTEPTEEEEVERVARTIASSEALWYEQKWGHEPPHLDAWAWEKQPNTVHEKLRTVARAAIAAMRGGGR